MKAGKLLALVSMSLLACGSDEGHGGAAEEQDPSAAADAAFATKPPQDTDAGSDAARSTPSNTCATVNTGVELQPVHLAFAFDVSGSMGMGDKPWHDKTLKWDPVVAATKAFFTSDTAKGLTASLTFFPSDDHDQICDEDEYTSPDVAFTALPSPVFGAAIDAIAPTKSSDWRSGTPTVAVMRGTQTFVADAKAHDAGRYAIVLVTDGYPQSCGALDTILEVTNEAGKALRSDVPTYVIGVANPKVKGAPDTVTNLRDIAVAGGTKQAVLIDTGDPAATVKAFGDAIEQIRQATISCNLAIPAESQGAKFDKQSVVVHYDSGSSSTELSYDKACTGTNGWHYDDVNAPKQIVLCDQACNTVRGDASAKLSVEFACEQRLVI